MKKFREYLPFMFTVVALGGVLLFAVYRSLNPIPPDQRAFTPKMKCRWIGDAEVCEPNVR